MHLHLLARALSIHGPTLFVNNACASGLYALEMAAAFLRDGKADLALVVAAESPAFPTKKMWFDELGIYADDGRQRPFDVDRRGLVFGEAGVALVVETREHARRRGASMRGHYLGGAFNQEAWKVAVPNLAANFYDRALAGACRNAGIAPGDVDLVNAHGAATPLSDLHEARGIVATFGDWPERPAVVAFKPYFGHTLGASALLETCCLLLCGENDCLVATPGFENPDPDLKVTPTRATAPKKLRTLLKMSNGFAGFNAAAVIRTIEEDRP